MPYSRQRPRIPANGRISIRLTTAQRDWFLRDDAAPKDLAQALHHAAVREGKLALRVARPALETLIAIAARAPATDRKTERDLAALLRYLESVDDRFDDRSNEDEDAC